MNQKTVLTKTLSLTLVAAAFLVSVSCSSRNTASDTETTPVATTTDESPYASDTAYSTGSDYDDVADLGTGSSGRSR